jgi:MFS family permease
MTTSPDRAADVPAAERTTAVTDRAATHRADADGTAADRTTAVGTRAGRQDALHRQKERFGGIKWGSAFFGWLTAVGTAALLSGIVAAAGGAADAAGAAPDPALDTGLVGAIVVAAVLFVAYFAGGYVAGRMARFSGAKQGVAVWVWAVVVAAAVAVYAAVSGVRLDLAGAAAVTGLPTDPTSLTTGGIVAVAVGLAVGLVGAVLGGLAGMRFHRRIDRAAHTEAA